MGYVLRILNSDISGKMFEELNKSKYYWNKDDFKKRVLDSDIIKIREIDEFLCNITNHDYKNYIIKKIIEECIKYPRSELLIYYFKKYDGAFSYDQYNRFFLINARNGSIAILKVLLKYNLNYLNKLYFKIATKIAGKFNHIGFIRELYDKCVIIECDNDNIKIGDLVKYEYLSDVYVVKNIDVFYGCVLCKSVHYNYCINLSKSFVKKVKMIYLISGEIIMNIGQNNPYHINIDKLYLIIVH